MPYGRRRRYRRGVRPRRRPYMKSEIKRLQTLVSDASINNTTGRVTLLNGIGEGPGIGQRVGRRIQMLSIHLRGYVQKVQANTQGLTSIRYALVLDKDPRGTAMTTAQYYNQAGSAFSMIQGRLQDNLSRFKTVCTFTIVVHGDSGSTTGAAILPWEKFCKLPYGVYYDAATATVADISRNALMLLEISDSGANMPTSELNATLRYKDP